MPNRSRRRVTLKDIAAELGVSSATVSLALRNDPRIAVETRERVHAAAAKLGYRPDPHLSQLMGYLREGVASQATSVIGMLCDWTMGELREHGYMSGLLRGIEERADQLGYRAEVFTRTAQLGYKRIHGILRARGIEGLIVLPHKSGSFSIPDFDFGPFTVVSVGYGMVSPELHRAASQQTRAAMQVVREVAKQGYRRIGLVIDRMNDARTGHRHMAGILGQMVADGIPIDVPVLVLEEEVSAQKVREWLNRHRPEAVVTSAHPPSVLLKDTGLIAGHHLGFAMINYYGAEKVARVQTPYHPMGLATVNLVHSLLCSHERGIPEIPQVLSVPGKWFPGETLPPREALHPWPDQG